MKTAALCASAALALTAANWFAAPVFAASGAQQACSQQYQAAKSAGTLNGQKWSDFYSSCAANLKSGNQTAQPATAALAAAPTTKAAKKAAAAAVAAAAPVASTAGMTTQQACSQQYQAAKAAGTLNGQKWPAYYSNCAAGMKSGAAPVQAAAPAAAQKVAPAMAAAAPASASAPRGQTTQQICSGQYQAAKSAGSLGGQSWGQFLSACAANIKNYSETSAPAPSEPPAVTQAQVKTMAAAPAATPTTDANGKALSAGEVAFRQRIHACSQQWQSEKADGTLPAGSQWPQFWSACNTQLKAQG